LSLTEARKRANAKYNAKAYDKVLVRLKAGQKDIIQSHADTQGESLNGFINRAIEKTMERDKADK
jgi:uncharacterized protein (DUF1778 family)